MRRLFLLAASLLLLAGSLVAQAPGYMGRRHIVRLYSNFIPGVRFEYDRPTYNDGTGPYLKHTDGLAYEFVASRRTTFSVSADHSRFGADGYRDASDGRYLCSPIGINFEFKRYPFLKRGFIAPLGPYFGLGFRALKGNVLWQAVGETTADPISSISTGSVFVSTGLSTLIGNIVLLDLGASYAKVLPAAHAITDYDLRRRITLSEMFRLRASLGILFGK